MSADRCQLTPAQTVGPFFHLGLTTNQCLANLAPEDASGDRIRLTIRLLDGDGAPVGDGMIELWQADGAGTYGCFGRLGTDAAGQCTFHTVRPGRVTGADGALQAPHINATIFARGLLNHLSTRIYFAGESSNAEDAVLALVPHDRRDTLLASVDPCDPAMWHFEIRLQGERETVFFDL